MGAKKSNHQRFIDLQSSRDAEIELIENLLAQLQEHQDRLIEIDTDLLKIVKRQIQGKCKKPILPFPQVESMLCDLRKDIIMAETSEVGQVKKSVPISNSTENTDSTGEVKQLIIRVSPKEKEQIFCNIQSVGYSTLNEYARKMLLDGYIIQWNFEDISALTKEMAVVNRNMNQIVKRANVTNSIYEGDFQDYKSGWLKLQTEIKSMLTSIRKRISQET